MSVSSALQIFHKYNVRIIVNDSSCKEEMEEPTCWGCGARWTGTWSRTCTRSSADSRSAFEEAAFDQPEKFKTNQANYFQSHQQFKRLIYCRNDRSNLQNGFQVSRPDLAQSRSEVRVESLRLGWNDSHELTLPSTPLMHLWPLFKICIRIKIVSGLISLLNRASASRTALSLNTCRVT